MCGRFASTQTDADPTRNTSGLGPCPDRLRITLDLFTAVAQPASRAIS